MYIFEEVKNQEVSSQKVWDAWEWGFEEDKEAIKHHCDGVVGIIKELWNPCSEKNLTFSLA